MILDLVHDVQKCYRKVLNCMARPGFIDNIQKASEKVDIDISFYSSTLVAMLMLLDSEVSFKIVSEKEKEITEFMNQLTYAKGSKLENADFIFIMSDAKPEDVEEAIRNAKPGNLIDPHKSATIVLEAEELSDEKELMLKGPGIEEANYVKIKTQGNWIEEREDKNIEYPLGVDMILVDKLSNILCLPRTTQVFKL